MTASVITAWETYSPLGHGAQAHLAGLASVGSAGPPRSTIDDFDVRAVLGRKGTRSMDRGAGLAVAATQRLLTHVDTTDGPFGAYAPEEIGVVLGVSDVIKSAMDFLRDTWTRDKPYDVDPSHVPRTLMNYAAGQCAIWHGIKGPNVTICGSHATGLLALNYARRLRQNRHAKAVVWGATEEMSADRVAVERARVDGHDSLPPGEGCVVFLLESAEAVGARTPLAEVLAVEFGLWTDTGGIRDALARCLRRALARAGVSGAEVFAIATSPSADAYEQQAVAEVFGRAPILTETGRAIGDTKAVSAAFQVVELLTHAGAAGRVGVVTTMDAEGRVGCALLRIC